MTLTQDHLDALIRKKEATTTNPWAIPMPRAPEDQDVFPEQLYGFPDDWDYKTAQTGPKGQPLRNGAVGWTPHGTAYYGTNNNFTEWWAGIGNRMTSGAAGNWEDHMEKTAQTWNNTKAAFADGEIGAGLLGLLGTGTEFLKALPDLGADEAGDTPSFFGYASRGIGEILGFAGSALGEVAQLTERTIFGGRAALDEIGDAGGLPDINIFRAVPEDAEDPQGFMEKTGRFMGKVWDTINPIDLTYDIYRAIASPVANKGDIFAKNFQSGRIAYSGFMKQGLIEEYHMRWKSGESAFLLEQELQDPIVEMVGEMIFDPLNVIAFIGKNGKNATKAFPDYTKYKANMLDEAPEIANYLNKSGDLMGWAKNQEFVKAVAETVKRVGSKTDNWASEIKLTGLTQGSKRIFSERMVGEFTGWLINSARRGENFNIDESLEALSAVVKLSSKNADEVAEGIAILGTFDSLPTGPIFSESGIRTSMILRSIMEDSKGVISGSKFMENLKGAEKLEDVLELMEGKVGKAIDKAIPTLAERATEVVDDAGNITKAAEKLGMRGELLRGAEKLAQSKPMRTMNSFFAHVYMGMNPGYAARNAITNNLHIFVDAGIGAFTQRGSLFNLAPLENFVQDFYGHLPGAFKTGIGTAGPQKDIGLFGKLTGWGLRAGQKGEQKASMRLFSHATNQIAEQMLQPGRVLPDIAPLVKAGLDPTHANYLQDLIIRNNGNVQRAADIFREGVATGKLDIFSAGGWIAPQTRQQLKDFNLWPQIEELLEKKWDNADDAIRHLNEEIYGDLEKVYSQAVKDGIHIPLSEPVVEELAAFDKMSNLPKPIKENVDKMAGANKYAEKLYREATTELTRVAKSKGIDLNVVLDEVPHVKLTLDGTWKNINDVENSEQTHKWLRLSDEVRGSDYSSKKLGKIWQREGMYGPPPKDLTPKSFLNHFWNDFFPQNRRIYWKAARDKTAADSMDYMHAITRQPGPGWSQGDLSPIFDQARQARLDAEDWDKFIPGYSPPVRSVEADEIILAERRFWEEPTETLSINIDKEKRAQDLEAMKSTIIADDFLTKMNAMRAKKAEAGTDAAKVVGKVEKVEPTAVTKASVRDSWGNRLIQEVDAGNGPTELTPRLRRLFEDHGISQSEIRSKSMDELIKEIRAMDPEPGQFRLTVNIDTGKKQEMLDDTLSSLGDELLGKINKNLEAKKPLPADFGEVPPSPERMMVENRKGLDNIRQDLVEGIQGNFGKEKTILPDPGSEAALTDWLNEATKRSNEMKFIANEVATEYRHFGLVDYGQRRNFDTVAGLIYPYHFWHSRTYPNWVKRAARQPHLLAAYHRYKEALAKIHAGAPEWWKYNINSNELFGLDSKNPIFFNLEQTLNPVNGLTGVDFDDPYKTTGWATQMLQDLNKFGPNTHTMFSFATALSLYYKGEEEAAARWGGRLFPQTKVLQSVDALFGDDPIEEYDPFVQFFSDGVDPYTSKAAGRAGATMELEGIFNAEEIQEGMFSRSGEVWDAAVERVHSERAPGQLFSFFAGAGFKHRSVGDMQTDKMYDEFFRLMDARPELSPVEFRNEMDRIATAYPFMDSVLISRKGGVERDTAYAYAVLRRIPPGISSEVYEMVGLDRRIISKFYDDKGEMEEWSKSDHDRFMAAIVDVAAVLKIPETATQAEWSQARNEFADLRSNIAIKYGKDIHEKIDVFFGLYGTTKEEAYAFLEQHPEIEQAMDDMEMAKIVNPNSMLTTYYSSIKDINDYYMGRMYNEAEIKFGEDIFRIQETFFALPRSEQKGFKRKNPQLDKYWKWSRGQKEMINKQVIRVGLMLKDITPAQVREDADLASFGAQDLATGIQQPIDPYQNMSTEAWRTSIGKFAFDYIADNLIKNRKIPSYGNDLLDREAQELGISRQRLIQYVGLAIEREFQLVLPQQ